MRCQLPEKTCLDIAKPSARRTYQPKTWEPASGVVEHLGSGPLLAVEGRGSTGVRECVAYLISRYMQPEGPWQRLHRECESGEGRKIWEKEIGRGGRREKR